VIAHRSEIGQQLQGYSEIDLASENLPICSYDALVFHKIFLLVVTISNTGIVSSAGTASRRERLGLFDGILASFLGRTLESDYFRFLTLNRTLSGVGARR
jgi:hypothetical protein